MKKILFMSALVLVFFIWGAAMAQEGAAAPRRGDKDGREAPSTAPNRGKAAAPVKSTADDRQSVELTVYNSDNGLVKERRTVNVAKGTGELHFVDVPSRINPVTVLVTPSDAQDFALFEQNYEYDLISHAKLMDKYVGKKIKIMRWNEYQDRREVVDAELLSAASGEVYKIDGKIYLGHPGIKILPELPGNLISRPTLSWLYRSRTGKAQTLDVSYLTGGMKWSADYVLAITSDSGASATARLAGWVTIDNRSGGTFENAKLKLVAGNLNRTSQARGYGAGYGSGYGSGGGSNFEQSALFDYHMYDLQHPTTIKDNQTKQISLLEAHGVKAEKEYSASYTIGWGRSSGTTKMPVSVHLKFKNTSGNSLGVPLPAGTVRVYTADEKGRQQFVGEDRITHTPRDEETRLRVGEAFDIVAERTMTNYKEVTSRIAEMDWEISVRNRKNENIKVTVMETVTRNTWDVKESSHKHKKTSAGSYEFEVPVKAGQEVVVKYRLRVGD